MVSWCVVTTRGLLWFACILVGSGCAHGATPLGGDWMEARSEHFVVKSNLEERELRDYTLEFEESYRTLRSCMYPGEDEPPGVSHVVLIGNFSEYESIRPQGSAGYYTTRRSTFESTPLIVIPARARARMLEVFQHELVHRFIRHYFPTAPRWLHEGLAQVLSTATIEDDGVVVGREISRMHWDGARWTVWGMALPDLAPDLTDLTKMNSAIFTQESVHAYPGSWAFVHTLMLGEPEYTSVFSAYLGDLRTGTLEESEAFTRRFDAPLLARIDKAYRQRLVTENLPTQVYPLGAGEGGSVAMRSMPKAEGFALWGGLRMDTADGRIQAIRDAEQAIASEPRSPEGYLLRASLRMRVGGPPDALKDIRKALEFAPVDQRLLRALGILLLAKGDAAEELDSVAIKVHAGAASADDFHFLARYELSKGRTAKGLEFAMLASREDDGCGACLETAAVAALKMGDLERAVRFQETAVRVVSEFNDELPRMEATLATYRKKLFNARSATQRPATQPATGDAKPLGTP